MDSDRADSAEQAARRQAGLDRPAASGAADPAAPAPPAGAAPEGNSAAEPDVEAMRRDAPDVADAEAPPEGGERARGVEG